MKEGKKESDFLLGIVDSHVQTAISLSNYLEFYGFKTLQAYNQEDVLKMIRENKFDLILLDMTLNGTNGPIVIQTFPKSKFILMVSEEKFSSLKFPNVLGVLKKPIDNAQLLVFIRKVLVITK